MGALDDIQDKLDDGLIAIDAAKFTLRSMKSDAAKNILQGINACEGPLSIVSDNVGRANKGITLIFGYKKVASSLSVINNKSLYRNNPEMVARAYGQLFVGAGEICSLLPMPICFYADFLKGAGDFFVNIQRAYDPESPHTKKGRYLTNVLSIQDKYSVKANNPCRFTLNIDACLDAR